MRTELGEFKRDRSGLFHYCFKEIGTIDSAIKDALANRPKSAAWFWFNGTPAPIEKNDGPESLFRRWNEWRTQCQNGSYNLLEVLQGLMKD